MMQFNVLCIGDIVGRPGRQVLAEQLESVKKEFDVRFVIANLENAAAGFGITKKIYQELVDLNINAFSSGNHIFDKREIIGSFEQLTKLVRPLNLPLGVPGVGVRYFQVQGKTLALVNVMGRVFMNPSDCPFQSMQNHLDQLRDEADFIFVDLHAETTSEKQAMGWYLDGKVTALFGTHTHVQTADERILPEGTAYISDLGMTGPRDSVIGMQKEPIIAKFFNQMPTRFEPEENSVNQLNGIVVTVDFESGKAVKVVRVNRSYE